MGYTSKDNFVDLHTQWPRSPNLAPTSNGEISNLARSGEEKDALGVQNLCWRNFVLNLIRAFPSSLRPFPLGPTPQKASWAESCTLNQHTRSHLFRTAYLDKLRVSRSEQLLAQSRMLRKLVLQRNLHLHPRLATRLHNRRQKRTICTLTLDQSLRTSFWKRCASVNAARGLGELVRICSATCDL